MTLAGGVLMISDRWTALPAAAFNAPSPAASDVDIAPGRWQAIVIHHSGAHTGSADGIARQQLRDWGVQGMGYHFVIGNGNGEYDGDVIAGPRWYQQLGGAHVAERGAGAQPDAAWFNDNTIGICLIGNGESRAFTDAQLKSLISLVRDLQAKCGIPSSRVFLHSDLAPIASPGSKFPREQFAFALSN
jgi:hypothetical protein